MSLIPMMFRRKTSTRILDEVIRDAINASHSKTNAGLAAEIRMALKDAEVKL